MPVHARAVEGGQLLGVSGLRLREADRGYVILPRLYLTGLRASTPRRSPYLEHLRTTVFAREVETTPN